MHCPLAHANYSCVTYTVFCYLRANSGQIVGEHGGTAFPFRFRWGNAVSPHFTRPLWVDAGRGDVNHALCKTVIESDFGSLECFVIIKCIKFGQLILRKIIKIDATRCQF